MTTILDQNQVSYTRASTPSGAFVPFARASTLAPFIEFLETVGSPTTHLLGKARIFSEQLEDPEALLPVMSIYRFIEMASLQEKLENFSAIVGEQTSAFDLGAFGAALQASSTINEYLRTGVRLIGALSSGERFWISEDANAIRVNQYLPGPASLGHCLADVYTLVITVSMLRRGLGPCWGPQEVRLMRGNERLVGDGQVFGNAQIITGAAHSSFTLPRSLLGRPMPGKKTREPASGYLSLLDDRPIPVGFVASMEQLLITLMSDQNPTIDVAAELAGMSPRTLQRRLADSGCTFKGLLLETRMEMAKEWLIDSTSPVADIADSLGYDNASNFIRAFRSRTGVSPQFYRQSRPDRQ